MRFPGFWLNVQDNIASGPALGLPTICGSLALVGSMGSLLMPSARAALYTITPTVRIVPQAGIIPITHEADSAGPMAKSVGDLADLLEALVDPFRTNVPQGGYGSAMTGSWDGVRIGTVDPEKWLFPQRIVKLEREAHDQMVRLC